ncbi:MAG: multidrug efflux SMR transporter [Selenomonas sp.]|nr:multidrug efflux SMR transporter [Selenomonas sp.]
MKGYTMLATAIILEIVSTSLLKASNGFTVLLPSLGFAAGMSTTFYLFSNSLKILPLGVAFAIWCGIGTAATAAVSVLLWGETITMTMILGMAAIVAGVILLNTQKPAAEV